MNDLRILIARLGWPSTSTRWWTMQELAARLGEPASMQATESLLFDLLRSRKLEAEVVEVLCIFWMAINGFNYSPSKVLSESIPLPSLLSDLLMARGAQSNPVNHHDLDVAPENFIIPDDFEGIQGVDLPRIYRTTLTRLESYSNLPFIQQMAFEWAKNRESYPDAPYQGDTGYFLRPQGEGFMPHFSTRSALRAISAYLRTLTVARHIWKMPEELANQKALLALPVHPTLAFLRPKCPEWLPASTEFNGDSKAFEASLRALLVRAETATPGGRLIALSSPVLMSIERCIEVSIMQWAQIARRDAEYDDPIPHIESFWVNGTMLSSQADELLSSTTMINPPTFEEVINTDCQAWPLAGTLDFKRIGYLQHELYPSRLFLPTLAGSAHKIEISPREGWVEARVKDKTLAELHYWNAGWGPVQPRQFGGNCGTALISRGNEYREGCPEGNPTLRFFYAWQVRILYRKGSHEGFSEALERGIIFD